jgi:hypothetical protein
VRYLFGQSFTYDFYPIDADGSSITPSADSPAIYVFHDRPDLTQALAGTSAIQTITNWTNSGNAWQFTISSLSPDGDEQFRTFYLGLNFTIEVGGSTQTVIKAFDVWRPLGRDEELSISTADVQAYFPQVLSFASSSQLSAMITVATASVKRALENKAYQFALVTNPSKLADTVIQKVLIILATSQIANGDEGFLALLEESKSTYRNLFNAQKLSYDASVSGEATEEVKRGFYSFIKR